MKDININDSNVPWTELILSGKKTIETRRKNTLKSFVNQKVESLELVYQNLRIIPKNVQK